MGTSWVQTDIHDAVAFNVSAITGTGSTYEFGIFDTSIAFGGGNQFALIGSNQTNASFEVSAGYLLSDLTNGNGSFQLTSANFGFYLFDGTSYTDYNFTSIGNNSFQLDWLGGNSTWILNDVNRGSSVPIPATVFLLGSGLVGLVGFSRKNKK